MDESRSVVEFNIFGLVMVHLNKSKLKKGVPHKLKMGRIGLLEIGMTQGVNQ